MKFRFKQRLARVRNELISQGRGCCMVISSAPQVTSSRDLHFPYRQSSDFFYLTGTLASHLTLVITGRHAKPILFTETADPVRMLWEGKLEDPLAVAKRAGAELRTVKNMRSEILALLKGADALYFQNESGSMGWQIAHHLMALPSHERATYPAIYLHSDMILERMRLLKDKEELEAMRIAAQVGNEAFMSCLDTVQPGVSENQIAASLDYVMRLHGCLPGFQSIVASGPSAAVLHYSAGTRKLASGDLLLIDWGAAFKMYCSDITRTIPVRGSFTAQQRDLYEIVLTAQKKALRKVRHGVKVKSVYDAAAKAITEGLCEMKVLRGKPSRLFEKKAFKPYFPHGIGHTVGLDAHDVGHFRGNNEAVLEAGMVFTIEPGLYFAKKTGKIRPCGIRIEDTVHVTARGHEVLTEGFPKEIDEVETVMKEIQDLEL